ncbi:hypothetical protein NIES2130_15370 [Scytonema sp. HK-05]|nr:hypothetical protein NIES2130_15370 [Scytonema sp. HK-05]
MICTIAFILDQRRRYTRKFKQQKSNLTLQNIASKLYTDKSTKFSIERESCNFQLSLKQGEIT